MESINQISEERRQFVRELARALARKLAYEDFAAEVEIEENLL